MRVRIFFPCANGCFPIAHFLFADVPVGGGVVVDEFFRINVVFSGLAVDRNHLKGGWNDVSIFFFDAIFFF